MLAGLLGRTVASADAINVVSVVVTNDEATYLLKRPQDFPPAEIPELIALAQRDELTELYRRSRVTLRAGRTTAPVEPGSNFNINRWSLHPPGASYFLPINELTLLQINALLEAFDEAMGLFIVDERAGFRPAGLARFARSRGGHLTDDPRAGRFAPIQGVEQALAEAAAIEQGMVLQNLGLMAQALGLGGFPNYALHPSAWFEALGFRMATLPASRYLGASRLASAVLGLLGRDQPLAFPVGLERDGEPLLKPFCPPAYPTMTAAVQAVVELKFGAPGVFRAGAATSGWRDPAGATAQIGAPSERAIAATIAYCEYVYQRYGRFPAYNAPFRTVLGYQATHVDLEFYDRFYRPEALTDAQREHERLWHGAG